MMVKQLHGYRRPRSPNQGITKEEKENIMAEVDDETHRLLT